MADPYISEIRIMSFPFAPKGWALCNGQTLPIKQNPALFQLLGTTFGGDGRTTVGLPDMRTRVPIGVGNTHVLGETGGEYSHTLTNGEMPIHTHSWWGTTMDANSAVPTGNFFAAVSNVYTGANNLTALEPTTVGNTGGGAGHLNQQPYLALSFCISLSGIYPPHP